MGNVLFYHLTRSPTEALLPILLGKSLQAGWAVELRGTDPARMERLDAQLWQGEGFLPHGLAGGQHDARQPVLLTVQGQTASNDAACLMSVDGAAVTADECAAAERVCVIFDGGDQAAVEHARTQWKALSSATASAEYWSEESGKWERRR